MANPRKNKTESGADPKTSGPQFTESIAMIMEQFKNPPTVSRFKEKLLKRFKYLVALSLLGALIYWGVTSVESVSLTNSGNSTQLIIQYKP